MERRTDTETTTSRSLHWTTNGKLEGEPVGPSAGSRRPGTTGAHPDKHEELHPLKMRFCSCTLYNAPLEDGRRSERHRRSLPAGRPGFPPSSPQPVKNPRMPWSYSGSKCVHAAHSWPRVNCVLPASRRRQETLRAAVCDIHFRNLCSFCCYPQL